MTKSAAVNKSAPLPATAKSTSTTTPTKNTPAPGKATPKKAPTKPAAEKPVKPSKPVREAANAIDTQIMKEKQEQDAHPKAVNAVKVNGNPAVKKAQQKDILFAWSCTGAEKVQITGSFNDWQQKLDMKPVADKHELSIPLEPGKYTYKFIVDGEWCYDFTVPNESDSDGNVNNVITV